MQQTKRIADPVSQPNQTLLSLQDEKLTKALIHTRFVKSEVAWKVPKKVPQEVVVKETLCKLKSHRKFLKPENQGSIFFKDYESCKFTFKKNKHYRTTGGGCVFAKSVNAWILSSCQGRSRYCPGQLVWGSTSRVQTTKKS